jgi:hypothetical protein
MLAVVTLVSLIGCATNPGEIVQSRIAVAWTKAATPNDARMRCNGTDSCYTYSQGICRIVSIDTAKHLKDFGNEIKSCLDKHPGTNLVSSKDIQVLEIHSLDNTKPILRIRSDGTMHNTTELQSYCLRFRGVSENELLAGCTSEIGKIWFIGVRKVAEDQDDTGHEAKHAFDGNWHDSRVPYKIKDGAFTSSD